MRSAIVLVALGLGAVGPALATGPPVTAPPPAQLPAGGRVVAGAATIAPGAGVANTAVLEIDQTTQRAVIDWTTFNIGSAAQVNFKQPSSSAVTLNRVLDSAPSLIFGKIKAIGQVFLTNPTASISRRAHRSTSVA